MWKWIKKIGIKYAIEKLEDFEIQDEIMETFTKKLDTSWMTQKQKIKFASIIRETLTKAVKESLLRIKDKL